MREASKGALHGAGTGKALEKEGLESQQWKETHSFVSPLCPTFPWIFRLSRHQAPAMESHGCGPPLKPRAIAVASALSCSGLTGLTVPLQLGPLCPLKAIGLSL